MRALPSHFANTCTFGRRLAKKVIAIIFHHIISWAVVPTLYGTTL